MSQIQLPIKSSEAVLPKLSEKETNISKSETKEFLSIMLSSIDKSKSLEEKSDIAKFSKEILDFFPELAVNIDEELDEDLSIEKASLMQLLKISQMLTDGQKPLKFPLFTEKLAKVLSNENTIKEFKDAKNLSDLIKVAKKYDLGLEKLKFSTENIKELESKFPLLKDKEFFQSKIANLTENILKTKNSKSNITTQTQNDDNSFLKDLINQIDKKEKELKAPISNKKEATAIKELLEKISQKEEKADINKIVQKEEKSTKVANLDKKEIMPTLDDLDDKTLAKETKTPQKTILPTDEKAQKLPAKDGESLKFEENAASKTTKENTTNKTIKENAIKTEANAKKISDILPSIEETKTQATPKQAFEEVLKPQNPPKQTLEIKQEQPKVQANNESAIKTEPNKEQSQNESQSSEQELSQNNQNSLIKEIAKAAQSQVKAPLRQTFSQFSQDLKEQIEQYKPPISKVQIALNPKNLGEVEVTIITRGSNLHINFSSNQQTMNLFIQNQQEFKNSLVNMGFTELQMNFSDQKENKKQQNFSHSKSKNDDNNELSDEQTSIELIMPQYV